MLRGRLREASNGRRSQRAKHEIALHDDRRHYVVNHGDRSHGRHRIDDNRGGEDRRPSYGASKRYRSERLGCQLLFSVRNIFLPIYSNFSIPAVFLSIPVITAVICSQ